MHRQLRRMSGVKEATGDPGGLWILTVEISSGVESGMGAQGGSMVYLFFLDIFAAKVQFQGPPYVDTFKITAAG